MNVIIQKSDLTEYAQELGVWDALLEAIGLDEHNNEYKDEDGRIELVVSSGVFKTGEMI